MEMTKLVTEPVTFRLKACVAGVLMPFEPWIVTGQLPAVPDAGVPENRPVVLLSVTPEGRVPAIIE